MKSGREIKTDMEMRFCGNYASVAAAAGVAGTVTTAGGFDSRGGGEVAQWLNDSSANSAAGTRRRCNCWR